MPQSMKAALDVLSELRRKKKIAVLGDMLEQEVIPSRHMKK